MEKSDTSEDSDIVAKAHSLTINAGNAKRNDVFKKMGYLPADPSDIKLRVLPSYTFVPMSEVEQDVQQMVAARACLQPASSKAPNYHHFLFPQVTDAQKNVQCSPLLSCLCPRWFLFLARSVESPRCFLFLGRFLVWGMFLFLGRGFTAFTLERIWRCTWDRVLLRMQDLHFATNDIRTHSAPSC